MTNSMNSIRADISINGQKLEQVPSLTWKQHQDCLGNGSNGQTKQDLAVQHHQLLKQVQAEEVTCHLHPLLQL